MFNDEGDSRLSLPEDIIDSEMIKEIESDKIKNEKLQMKRNEINAVKNEIKTLEEKLQLLKDEYDKISSD